ncbi:MAG: helix-turn-helix domain-containing protein [Planctomycetes bacterium]|nr:helix-turn-helix domain-containing protein [Planctomycetota bacterium]
MGETKPVQSLLRGIDLLEILSEAPEGMRLNDIADAMGLKTPTVHNLVKTLASRNMIVKRNGNQYAVGPALLALASRLKHGMQLSSAEKVIRELSAMDCGPVINYSTPLNNRLLVRIRMSPDRPGIIQHPEGQTNSLYGSATGLAFLAFAPDDHVLSMRQASPFHEYGIRLWESLESLKSYIASCRELGYAVTPFAGQELFRVAAPVRDRTGVTVAYLGASVPFGRMSDKKEQSSLIEAFVAAAKELSA